MPAPGVWRKSSYSGSGPNCVQVAFARGVRDSKKPYAGHLTINLAAYQALLGFAKRSSTLLLG